VNVRVVIAYAVLLLFVSCAQVVSPTGGPKDETPPQVKAELPANRSVNFTAKKFVVNFDEYVQLNNPSENVIISPPMLQKPTYTLKKRSLVVEWEEELNPDATYIFNFGEAIKDNNEGNLLNNYTYVFSTGAALDSMELKGKLIDALTGDPVEGAMLMLYRDHADSLPRTTLPDYFGRTGKDGHFLITNIPDLPFKAFALKDQNSNFRFDVPNEQFGFVDTLVRPVASVRPLPQDSASTVDSLAPPPAPAPVDSLGKGVRTDRKAIKGSGGGGQFLQVSMSVEEDTTQFLQKASVEQHGKFMFAYNRPVSRFRALLPAGKVKGAQQWALREFNTLRDTIHLWTLPSAPDTLDLILYADARIDTVQLINKERPQPGAAPKAQGRGTRGKAKPSDFRLRMASDPPAGMAPLPGRPLWTVWSHPVTDLDLSRMELREDSLLVSFNLIATDTALRRFGIDYPWKVGKKYQLSVRDSAATDIFGLRNDTARVEFTGIDDRQLGELALVVTNLSGQKVLELLNATKQVVERRVVRDNGTVQFPELVPGKYALVMVDDRNANGRWDAGRYAYRLQPEPIFILRSDIEVRANWQMELQWDASGTELR
jgi:hypothetical protein